MTDNRILFGDFKIPRINGLEYLLNEEKIVTDYLFVNEPHERFSMYFETDFPKFKVPENGNRPYSLFEIKRPDRMIKFFCPEKLHNLDTVVWYFYMELVDDVGVKYCLPGQVRVGMRDFHSEFENGKPKFIEILESITLNTTAVTA